MIYSFNKLERLALTGKVQYITLVNKYNYCIKQLRIDNEKNTITEGQFTFNKNITTGSNYRALFMDLTSKGYKFKKQ